MVVKNCKECGKIFIPKKYLYQIFCSKNCRWKYKNRKKKKCIDCGELICNWKSIRCNKCKNKAERSYLWKGGRIRKKGYIWIYKPNHPFARKKYVLEHRLVIEKKLGRYLTKEERVHHINGIKDDNRPENLMLLKNTGEHSKLHPKKKLSPEHHRKRKKKYMKKYYQKNKDKILKREKEKYHQKKELKNTDTVGR